MLHFPKVIFNARTLMSECVALNRVHRSDDGITILNCISSSRWTEGSAGGGDNGISVTHSSVTRTPNEDCSCVVPRKDRNTHLGSSGDRWPLTRTSRLRSSPPGRLSFWRPACLQYKVYYLAVTRTASSVFLGTGWRGAERRAWDGVKLRSV